LSGAQTIAIHMSINQWKENTCPALFHPQPNRHRVKNVVVARNIGWIAFKGTKSHTPIPAEGALRLLWGWVRHAAGEVALNCITSLEIIICFDEQFWQSWAVHPPCKCDGKSWKFTECSISNGNFKDFAKNSRCERAPEVAAESVVFQKFVQKWWRA